MRKIVILALIVAATLAALATVMVVVIPLCLAQGSVSLQFFGWLEVVVFIGIFLGCLFRTLAPAVKKMRNDPEFKWNHVYTVTVIASVLVALATAIIGFAGYLIPTDLGSGLRLFAVCFVYGVGLNSTINEVASWFGT